MRKSVPSLVRGPITARPLLLSVVSKPHNVITPISCGLCDLARDELRVNSS